MHKSSDYLEALFNDLSKMEGLDVRKNESLSRHTTLKVGGPADMLVYPKSQEDLEKVFQIINHYRSPWRVWGRGSNVIVRDGGIRGVVLKLDEGFNDYSVDGSRVLVSGGLSTILLSTIMTKSGLTGFEFAGGIPGNIGGAVYMNAGAHGSEIADVLLSAEVLLPSGKSITLSNTELGFRYRTSVLQKELNGIVTKAIFQLSYGEKETISSTFNAYKDQRKRTQPLQFPCAGSVFRNPPQDYAGRLIEQAGLKGYRIGDAEVSMLHGNFIINRGAATAKDVLALIATIIDRIKRKYNVVLKPEVQVVGEE